MKPVKTLFFLLDKVLLLIFILFLVFIFKVRIVIPDVDTRITPASYQRIKISENHYKVNNCWLRKNSHGIWEMYLEGSPYERGVIYGVLAKEIVVSQEEAFVNQLNEIIPSRFFQHFLQFFVSWFNRDMDEYVKSENLAEIYGISQSFADKYDYIGPKFYRILYYHAAHDIGHALADMRIVGCTSFSVNGSYTSDGKLLLGRNFDFYMGEEFAKDKLLLFLKPQQGYAFASYSWAGFTGVVSGMNEKGLTVTLNASQSDIPGKATTPISLLAREILQYAKNIKEAVEIATHSGIFVSESLLIGSAEDGTSALIEKGPEKMDVFYSKGELLVCSNHYQGKVFKQEKANLNNLEWSDSRERFARMQELIEANKPLDYSNAAAVLRDKNGLNDKEIGLGNAKAVNQLIAHHSVIFKPANRKLWVSTPPYQMGAFLSYDLDEVFKPNYIFPIVDSLEIPADPFLASPAYEAFKEYRKSKEKIAKNLLFGIDFNLSDEEIKSFIRSNPESYEVYFLVGKYYDMKEQKEAAKRMYLLALSKEIASKKEGKQIEDAYSKKE